MKRVCYFEIVDEERKRWLTDVRIVRMRERTSEREQETDGSGGVRERKGNSRTDTLTRYGSTSGTN